MIKGNDNEDGARTLKFIEFTSNGNNEMPLVASAVRGTRGNFQLWPSARKQLPHKSFRDLRKCQFPQWN
jgi:hypothetical protein